MNDSLYRLVYISRNRVDHDLAGQIAAILAASRALNEPAGITGALMYNDGCFAQVLEGEHDALQDTFERIQCDERHDEVRLLGLEPIAERGFGGWSMAYVGRDETARDAFARLAPAGVLDPESLPPGRIYALLKEHLADAERGAPPTSAAA